MLVLPGLISLRTVRRCTRMVSQVIRGLYAASLTRWALFGCCLGGCCLGVCAGRPTPSASTDLIPVLPPLQTRPPWRYRLARCLPPWICTIRLPFYVSPWPPLLHPARTRRQLRPNVSLQTHIHSQTPNSLKASNL
jgi:hypothetical protein